MIAKGTRVTWQIASSGTAAATSMSGLTIADQDGEHILVAVDAPVGQMHDVVYCHVGWLVTATSITPAVLP